MAGPVQILVVDDEEPIRNALKKFLAQQQYEVYAAGTGEEALQQLRRHRIALMLCDIRMPGTSGVDLVPQAIEIEPELAILMLTAVNDATSAALCMQRGAMDYLTKPIELADLGRAVQRALKRREMLLENRHLNQWLKEEVTTRTAELQRERMKLERLSIATLEALVNALEAKDPYMRGHSARVADLSATVAHQLGMSEEDVELVRIAGRLHDIGKIGTREAVLNKQGTLTPEEFEHVRQHVIIGSQILAPLTHLGDIIPAVRHHHERFDGTGYPDGLRGEAIPLSARVLGAAEVYDALTTSRAYQEKMTPDKAIGRIADLAGTVLDPAAFEGVHVDGTGRLLAAARDAGVRRFVHMSAVGARDEPQATRYHRTKWRAEQLVRGSGLSHAIFRPSIISGPENRPIRTLARLHRWSPLVPVFGDGRFPTQPVWIEDVALAFALAAERPALGGVFELGGPGALTYEEFGRAVGRAAGHPRPLLHVPLAVARAAAAALGVMGPLAPLTLDQLQMLVEGSTTPANALESTFGIRALPFEAGLARFLGGGRR